MVAPEVQGIDLFKIAGRSISGWIPSLKMDTAVEAAIWKVVGDSTAQGHLLVDLEQFTLDRTLPPCPAPT